ncbi:hypothetical protein BvCmsSINP027_02780 [Escherichia coli]|nr:hypothetical protein BvCmsSINP027_02780 [Escherichia coli]
MSNTHVKNIKLGACKVSFGGVDLGYTKGGVQVEVATETLKVTVDQLGQTVISELVQGRNITITAPLAESVLQNMVDLMPGSTLSEDDNSVTITSAQGVTRRLWTKPISLWGKWVKALRLRYRLISLFAIQRNR